MNVLILMGSPRLRGNTAELCKPLMEELKEQGAEGSLWAGKKVAIIATHGYEGAFATDPFEMGVERLCTHSDLTYVGLYSVKDEENLASFQTEEAIAGAKAFARKVLA